MRLSSLAKSSLLRPISVLVCASMLFSTCFPAMVMASDSIRGLVIKIGRKPKGDYTDKPRAAFLGLHPGKWAHHRGGLWTDKQLAALAEAKANDEFSGETASTKFAHGQHLSSGSDSDGPSLPWEGGLPSASGTMNTSNGNNLTEIPLFSWNQRGGLPIKFSLFQNSESSSTGGPGDGWTSSFQITISTSSGSPVVTWANGQAVPYTLAGGGAG